MKRYEVKVKAFPMPIYPGILSVDLYSLGQKGWSVVSVTALNEHHGATERILVTLQREITEGSENDRE